MQGTEEKKSMKIAQKMQNDCVGERERREDEQEQGQDPHFSGADDEGKKIGLNIQWGTTEEEREPEIKSPITKCGKAYEDTRKSDRESQSESGDPLESLLSGLCIKEHTFKILANNDFQTAAALMTVSIEDLTRLGVTVGQASEIKSRFNEACLSSASAAVCLLSFSIVTFLVVVIYCIAF